MTDWIPYANFGLNLLIIPLVKILWDIKQGLTRLEEVVAAHHARLDRLERQQDRA
jgi:hypothetical protein